MSERIRATQCPRCQTIYPERTASGEVLPVDFCECALMEEDPEDGRVSFPPAHYRGPASRGCYCEPVVITVERSGE